MRTSAVTMTHADWPANSFIHFLVLEYSGELLFQVDNFVLRLDELMQPLGQFGARFLSKKNFTPQAVAQTDSFLHGFGLISYHRALHRFELFALTSPLIRQWATPSSNNRGLAKSFVLDQTANPAFFPAWPPAFQDVFFAEFQFLRKI